MPEELDAVWKALSDPTRRAILDLLRQSPRTTTTCSGTTLVETREEGRQRVNSLNVVPIRQIYERLVGRFEELWSSQLLRINETAESGVPPRKEKEK